MEGESEEALKARVETLWATLDTRKEGSLDLAGLKKGLKRMDHPLKNADELLDDVMKAVDTNGDGRIQYHEFDSFVRGTEEALSSLFKSIDRDKNGKLDKTELKEAFLRAGLAVPSSKLDDFFSKIDSNNDGVISFEEWRDFLLFIPVGTPGLRAVLSYFSSTVKMSPEGDVSIGDETIRGLGTDQCFLSVSLGALVRIVNSQDKDLVHSQKLQPSKHDAECSSFKSSNSFPCECRSNLPSVAQSDAAPTPESKTPSVLTEFMPNPGYFLAGGVAGIISRTATAPLDRLRVYLIAQTGVAREAVEAAKSGAPLQATRKAWKPLVDATKELWKAGGVRSLFAGNGLNIVKVMPESAIKFGSYEAAKRVFSKVEGHGDPKLLQPWLKFVAGGISGMVAQFAVYPIDTLKFRMQCETVEGGLHGNQLIVTTAKKMWATERFRSYYRGLPMGLAGMFPYAAIDLGTFEYLKKMITSRNAKKRRCHEEDAQPGSVATAAIGGFSGALGASVVYPLNLLRTRLQTQGTVLHQRTYTGIVDVTRQTIRGEGFRGLFKGITPNLLKVVPAVSITYVVYENSKKILKLP